MMKVFRVNLPHTFTTFKDTGYFSCPAEGHPGYTITNSLKKNDLVIVATSNKTVSAIARVESVSKINWMYSPEGVEFSDEKHFVVKAIPLTYCKVPHSVFDGVFDSKAFNCPWWLYHIADYDLKKLKVAINTILSKFLV